MIRMWMASPLMGFQASYGTSVSYLALPYRQTGANSRFVPAFPKVALSIAPMLQNGLSCRRRTSGIWWDWREWGQQEMSDTQVLLNQIVALRQRLEQVQGLMSK